MTAPRRPTLADVAMLANVDSSVVSRVLNNDSALRVRDETRERVLEAIRELGYRRNVQAQSLRTKRANAIGLVIPTYDNPVYTAVIEGAAAASRDRDAFLLTASLTTLNTVGAGGSPLDLLATGRVDGLLVGGHDYEFPVGDFDVTTAPVLTVNRRIPGFDRWVVLDDEGASTIAVNHLVDAGHREIAHIAGPLFADTASRRQAGFESAMRERGLAIGESRIVGADYTIAAGAAAARALIVAPSPPTALVAANVASAIGALYALRRSDVKVPDDISIVAIHDSPLGEYLDPPLTVVEMPLFQLGRRGVELLFESPGSEPINEVVEGPMRLIRRGSTRSITGE
jgi:LacI family transcriptional regulator, galactose operon repressor